MNIYDYNLLNKFQSLFALFFFFFEMSYEQGTGFEQITQNCKIIRFFI